MGRYEGTPGDRVNGIPTYLLTDIKGRLISRVNVVDDEGHIVDLIADHDGNLRVTHPEGLKSVMVNEPGVAYANGANALCLAAPSDENHHLDLIGVYLSTNAAGSFYLVTANLGLAPGATTANIFDLVGVMGDDIVNICDVTWAAFMGNQRRGVTGGNWDMHTMAGEEVYLIAPNVNYHIHVNYLEEL